LKFRTEFIYRKLTQYFGLLLLFVSANLHGQEGSHSSKNHTISAGIGHIQVAKGIKDGNKTWVSLPSWALDYHYSLSENWSISLQNEIVQSDFEVEDASDEVITRSSPYSAIVAIGYKPLEVLTIFTGVGGEFAREENFGVVRFGIEPSWEIGERFELLLCANYDVKIEAYDSFGINLGVGYKF